MKNVLMDSVFYKNRHIFGFFLVGILLYFFIVVGFARYPVGLSLAEKDTAILSAGFSFPDSIINLPYIFLQWLSVILFDLSTFSLRLPSVLLALTTAGLIIAAIRNFTKSSVAITTGLIMSCSVFFLNFARSGSPEIMGIFLMSLAIFAISQIVTGKKKQLLWLSLLMIAITLGVYVPGGIVFFIALLIVILVNKRSREIIGSLKKWQIAIAIIVGIIVLTPLILSIIVKPELLFSALGINNFQFSPNEILTNLQAYFLPSGADFGGYVTPLISFGQIALAVFGVIKLISDRKSSRAIFTLITAGITFIISLFMPAMSFLMFVPWVFLMAFGMLFVIDYWYDMFPLNPYARTLGFIPIGILVIALMMTDRASYLNANFYDARVINSRDSVFEATRQQLNSLAAHEINLVAPKKEMDFYKLFEKTYPTVTVTEKYVDKQEIKILLPGTFDQIKSEPTLIVTGANKTDGILSKVYQNYNPAKLDSGENL